MQSWMIGIVLGILPVGLLPRLPDWPAPWVLYSLAALLLPVSDRRVRLCAGLALGCGLAIAHGHELLQNRLQQACVAQSLIVVGAVSSLPRRSFMPDGAVRQRFEYAVESINPRACRGPQRLLLSYYGDKQLVPGARWQFSVKLKKPWGLANPGSFNMQAWFAQTGIDAVGSVTAGGALRLQGQERVSQLHHRLRQDISGRITQLGLSAEVAAILRAITVADKSGIDHHLWSLFQGYGVNHLLVISGLHIGLVAGAGYLLGAALARTLLWSGIAVTWLPGIVSLLFAAGYAALAGFSLATLRALCMLSCFILAGLLGRSSGSATNLLMAAVLILVLNPLAALGSGFWLSFGAVAGLLWLAPWQQGRALWQRMGRTHVYMSLLMLPMGTWWFGGSSLVSAAANFLMIPLVGFVVVPVALLAVLAYLLGWAIEPLLWHLAAWPVEQLLPVARDWIKGSDGWMYGYFSADLVQVLLALLAVMLLALPLCSRRKLLVCVLALPLLLPRPQSPAMEASTTRVTVLDVGQGTAVVIRAGDRAMLYDTGGGDPAGANMATSVILPYLRSTGVTRLDTFVVSHSDMDHSAGMRTILQALPVGRVYLGAGLSVAGGARSCVAGQAWRWPGGQHFQFLSPALEPGLATNDGSCVLQIDIGSRRLLLPGDIEHARERTLLSYWRDRLRSDWLLVAHHGSLTSSTRTLLKTVQPATVVISSGYANRFGHPHPEILQRLYDSAAAVWITADSGALEFRFTPGRPPEVQAYRQIKRRFWM